MEAVEEQAAQFFRLERSRTVRKGWGEEAEKIRRLGGGATIGSVDRLCPPEVINLMASSACSMPMTPTTGPSMPPSPQLMTVSAGGGVGKTQR